MSSVGKGESSVAVVVMVSGPAKARGAMKATRTVAKRIATVIIDRLPRFERLKSRILLATELNKQISSVSDTVGLT